VFECLTDESLVSGICKHCPVDI